MAPLFHYEVNGTRRTVGEFVSEMEILLSKVSARSEASLRFMFLKGGPWMAISRENGGGDTWFS